MPNVGIVAPQDKGKTATAVAACLQLVMDGVYVPSEGVGNVAIQFDEPGYQFISNAQLKRWFGEVVKTGIRHRFIVVDEATRVFPARGWKDQEQTDIMTGLFQDIKLFNWAFFTFHPGTTVDVLLRNAMQTWVIPEYVKEDDAIYLTIHDGLSLVPNLEDVIYPASYVFLRYDRWALAL